MSEEMTPYQRLNQLKFNLVALKNQKNTFGNYNYRTAEAINQSIKPLAIELDLLVGTTDKLELIGDRYYIKATAYCKDCIDGKTIETSDSFSRECQNKKGMDESQITGSASSYAKKYALSALLSIDNEADADKLNVNNDYSKKPKQEPPKKIEEMPKVKQEYIDKMVDIAEERYGKGDKFPILLAWLQYEAEGCIDLFASKNMIESQIFELSEKQLSTFAYKSARDYLLKTLKENKQQGETK